MLTMSLLLRSREGWILGCIFSLIYGLVYLGWNFMWFGINGVYPYPSIQQEPGYGGRAGTYIGILCALMVFYLLMRWFSNRIWREALAMSERPVITSGSAKANPALQYGTDTKQQQNQVPPNV